MTKSFVSHVGQRDELEDPELLDDPEEDEDERRLAFLCLSSQL